MAGQKRLEQTNYFKKNYISNMRLGNITDISNKMFLYSYLIMFFVFLYFIYDDVVEFRLVFSVPFFYIGCFIFLVGFYFLIKGKTTLKGIKPIYGIMADFFTIAKDNSLKKYNKKNYYCNNELKTIKIEL